eukprot:UN29672
MAISLSTRKGLFCLCLFNKNFLLSLFRKLNFLIFRGCLILACFPRLGHKHQPPK